MLLHSIQVNFLSGKDHSKYISFKLFLKCNDLNFCMDGNNCSPVTSIRIIVNYVICTYIHSMCFSIIIYIITVYSSMYKLHTSDSQGDISSNIL